jgi:hypothetical protein
MEVGFDHKEERLKGCVVTDSGIVVIAKQVSTDKRWRASYELPVQGIDDLREGDGAKGRHGY